MNAISKPDLMLGTIEDVKAPIRPETPVAPTLSARIFNFFDAWTQHSYDAWEKAGRPEREF
jgi:hypothetical protein